MDFGGPGPGDPVPVIDMEKGTRRRKQNNSQIDEDFSTATKDPLVRESAKPPGESTVDEKWDLEDDEDWVDGQTPGKEQTETAKEVSRRRRILKRGALEVGIASAFHLAILCAYIYIHVYDATVVKKTMGKGFPGLLTYGGRWKYLTYINLVRKHEILEYPLPNFLAMGMVGLCT